MSTKECTSCNTYKSFESFHKRKASKDGLAHICKKCTSIANKKWRKENKKRAKKTQKEYYKKNKKKVNQYKKRWYQQNKDMVLESRKKYRKENLESIQSKKKKYYEKNKKAIRAKQKRYREKNKDIRNKKEREKRKNCENTRILNNLRARIGHAISKDSTKSKSTKELLGCSVKEFKNHLQKKFEPGMTWNNYGSEWHIDHIKPCSEFNLVKESHQKECFHYTNTQPLWADENLSKGAKYTEDE